MATKQKRLKLDTNLLLPNLRENRSDDGITTCAAAASIYILPHKIQKRRLEILQSNSRAKNLPLVEEFREDVTYIVSELDSREQTLKALPHNCTYSSAMIIVKSSWLSRCIKAGKIVDVEEEEQILSTETATSCELIKSPEVSCVAEYACQRIAMLRHPNEMFTRSLEVLEEYADFKDDELNYSRALAFRRASAVLKSLNQRVSNIQDVKNLPDIGGHCLLVIQEILENGFSSEVESIEESSFYKKMKLFTSVFGVGPATAKKWINMGLSTIAEAKSHSEIAARAEPRVSLGLTYFDDLNTPVKISEAEKLAQMIQDEVESIRPGALVELAGGFRRGKDHGHDIDLLITHPVDGQENGILIELLQRLEEKKLVMFGRREPCSFNDHVALMDNKGSYLRSTLDHFEKWIGVLKIYSCQSDKTSNDIFESNSEDAPSRTSRNSAKNTSECHSEATVTSDGVERVADHDCNPRQTFASKTACRPLQNQHNSWIARRVDLIVIPNSQFFYGLVGWTGNRHFNRSLRLYAQKELGMKLTSHGLFDKLGKSVPAKSEMEVFQNLKLPYRQPFERNC